MSTVLNEANIISDPAILLFHSKTFGGEGSQSLGRKPKKEAELGHVFFFVRDILPKRN